MSILLHGLLAMAALGTPLSNPAPVRCSMSTTPFRQGPRHTATWVTATADTGLVGWGTIEPKIGDGHAAWTLDSDSLVWAQRFFLNAASWVGADLLSDETQVWIVLWDYDGGCKPSLWMDSSRWAHVGSDLFVLAELRPRQHWIAGIPTMDTFFAGMEVYPASAVRSRSAVAAQLDSVYTAFGVTNPDTLPVRDIFSKIDGLPALCAWAQRPRAASRQFRSFLAARPDGEDRAPWGLEIGWHAGRADDYKQGLISPRLVQRCGDVRMLPAGTIIGVVALLLMVGLLVFVRRAKAA